MAGDVWIAEALARRSSGKTRRIWARSFSMACSLVNAPSRTHSRLATLAAILCTLHVAHMISKRSACDVEATGGRARFVGLVRGWSTESANPEPVCRLATPVETQDRPSLVLHPIRTVAGRGQPRCPPPATRELRMNWPPPLRPPGPRASVFGGFAEPLGPRCDAGARSPLPMRGSRHRRPGAL